MVRNWKEGSRRFGGEQKWGPGKQQEPIFILRCWMIDLPELQGQTAPFSLYCAREGSEALPSGQGTQDRIHALVRRKAGRRIHFLAPAPGPPSSLPPSCRGAAPKSHLSPTSRALPFGGPIIPPSLPLALPFSVLFLGQILVGSGELLPEDQVPI